MCSCTAYRVPCQLQGRPALSSTVYFVSFCRIWLNLLLNRTLGFGEICQKQFPSKIRWVAWFWGLTLKNRPKKCFESWGQKLASKKSILQWWTVQTLQCLTRSFRSASCTHYSIGVGFLGLLSCSTTVFEQIPGNVFFWAEFPILKTFRFARDDQIVGTHILLLTDVSIIFLSL